jgi:hypothetical protein
VKQRQLLILLAIVILIVWQRKNLAKLLAPTSTIPPVSTDDDAIADEGGSYGGGGGWSINQDVIGNTNYTADEAGNVYVPSLAPSSIGPTKPGQVFYDSSGDYILGQTRSRYAGPFVSEPPR